MSEITNFQNQSTALIPEEAANAVNEIFKILACHIPFFQFNTLQGGDYEFTKREWIKCFARANLKKTDVSRGLDRIRQGEYQKSNITPNEFISLTKAMPHDIGAPCVDSAYREACRNSRNYEESKTWTHPVVRYAFNHVGSYNLSRLPRESTYPDFEKAYLEACDLFQKGELKTAFPTEKQQQCKEKGEHTFGKYEFVRPGVMKIYENICDFESGMMVMNRLVGKGDAGLKKLIKNIEARHKAQGGL